jgi:hypothetical protein
MRFLLILSTVIIFGSSLNLRAFDFGESGLKGAFSSFSLQNDNSSDNSSEQAESKEVVPTPTQETPPENLDTLPQQDLTQEVGDAAKAEAIKYSEQQNSEKEAAIAWAAAQYSNGATTPNESLENNNVIPQYSSEGTANVDEFVVFG